VSTSESTRALVCDHCGQPCTDVDGGRDFVHLEVTRERPVDGTHWWEVDFCSQEHAAAWLSEPLPERNPGEGTTAAAWENALGIAVVLAFVGIFGLGVWTAIRLLISLF
jgi:hypothetical protein